MIEKVMDAFHLGLVVMVICFGIAGYFLLLLRRHFKLLNWETMARRYDYIRRKYQSRG